MSTAARMRLWLRFDNFRAEHHFQILVSRVVGAVVTFMVQAEERTPNRPLSWALLRRLVTGPASLQ